jgi:lipopolysaccharide biosynthesis glycosyltransferase
MTDGSKILGNTFNAGFIIIGKKFLNPGTYEELKKLIHSEIFEPVRTHNTDQVVLNIYFDEQCHILPFEYNLVISKWPMLRDTNTVQADNIKIMHFTGKYKPWEPDSGIIELAANPDFGPFFEAWDLEYEEVKQELSKLASGR